VSASASYKSRAWDARPDLDPYPVDELFEAAERIERAAEEIQVLNSVLKQVDKNITAAAKRAVKRSGSSPLRLNSRRARQRDVS
jgi:type II secretory pathway component PulJ